MNKIKKKKLLFGIFLSKSSKFEKKYTDSSREIFLIRAFLSILTWCLYNAVFRVHVPNIELECFVVCREEEQATDALVHDAEIQADRPVAVHPR